MEISLDSLPDDPAALRAMILAQQQKIIGMEAANRAYEALIQALKLTIARLKRQRYGASSEKIDREIAQLELACAHHGDPTTDSMNIRPGIPRSSDHPLQQHPTGMI